MSKSFKALCISVFLLSSLFICVGYAALSGSLSIEGSAEFNYDPHAIQIVGVEVLSGNAEKAVPSGQVLAAKITLADGESIVAITVRNNTDIKASVTEETYGYNSTTRYEIDGITYNENIQYTVYSDVACTVPIEKGGVFIDGNTGERENFGFTVDPGKGNERTFYIKFTFAEGADTSQSTVEAHLSFNFMPLEEIYGDASEEAIDNALQQFEAILNNEVAYGDGSQGSFTALVEQMENYSSNGRVLPDYIGNVDGASDSDKELIDNLFGGMLNINIDGVDTPVTFLIKYDDIYSGAGGDEMTIYMTTENLTTKETTFTSTQTAVVYAAVYTSSADEDGNTVWSPLTDIIEGTAIVCDYDGGPWAWLGRPTGSGSFRTDDWRSTAGETITNAIS